jgi:hypothetical protein
MSLLSQIAKLFEPEIMTDPLFGMLRRRRGRFWEASCYFAPAGKEINVLIAAQEDGPSEKQREFYLELGRQYSILAAAVGDLLHEKFTNWQEDFPREKIWEEFQLAGVTIPQIETFPLEWELSYVCASDDHSFDVQMRDMRPDAVSLNG